MALKIGISILGWELETSNSTSYNITTHTTHLQIPRLLQSVYHFCLSNIIIPLAFNNMQNTAHA